jgi:DNA invertase Pin-like site-specific DNA recombinase
MNGDSLRRQREAAVQYARRHGLELDDSLTFRDLGVSAFHGRNAEAGRLGDFREAVREGLVPQGCYLLVENLDRISRQTARKALRVLEDIVDAGVIVVTLSDGREYTVESLNNDPTSLIMAILTFVRANEESAMKARRLRSAWEHKRERAGEKALTARGPAWLWLNDARQFEVIEERAEIVRRIYFLTLAGWGQHRIAETLNREGIPTFGRSKMWNRSYVKKVLESPAVVGTYIPHVIGHEEGRRTRTPLEPIPDYYPAVVDLEDYERVQALRGDGKAPIMRGTSGELLNVLAGLARCPLCGSTMTRVNKGNAVKGGKPFLVCTKAKAGAGCTYRSVKLDRVESALQEEAGILAVTAPSPNEELNAELEGIEARLAGVEIESENVQNAIAEMGGSPALLSKLRRIESEQERLERLRDDLEKRWAAASGPLLAKKLRDLDVAFAAEPLDRSAANAILRQLFASITVDYRAGLLRFAWKHGGESEIAFAWPEDEEWGKAPRLKEPAYSVARPREV